MRTEEIEEPRVMVVDLHADRVRNPGVRTGGPRFPLSPEDEEGLVLGALFQDRQHVPDVRPLVRQELLLRHQQVPDDLVGGGDDAALVRGGVAEDDDAAVLEPVSRLRRQEGIRPLHDHPGGGRPVLPEEPVPVRPVDRFRAAPRRQEEVRGHGEQQFVELLVEFVDRDPRRGDAPFGPVRTLVQFPKPFRALLVPVQEEAAGVELLGPERLDVAGQDDPRQLRAVDPRGVAEGSRAVEDQADRRLRAPVEEDPHRVPGHVAVRSPGELHGKWVRADVHAELAHGDLGELDHTRGGHPVLLVVDPDLLARHDPDPEDVPPPHRQLRDRLDHRVVHVLVGPELDRLVLAVVIHHPRLLHLPVLGDEDVEEGVDEAVLDLVQALVHPFFRLEVRGVDHRHQLRPALVDVLVLQVLRVGEDVVLPEEGVRDGDVIVAGPGEEGPPSPPGDVGEPDVVAEPVSSEEEGDPEGTSRREIRGEFGTQVLEVGGIEPEREGVLLGDEEVRLERPPDEGERGPEDRPAELVQLAVPRVVLLDLLRHRRERGLVRGGPVGDLRIEPQLEEVRELEGDVGVGVERPRDVFQREPVRLVVCEVRMAEADEGVHERRLFPRHQPCEDERPVDLRTGAQDLGVVELAAKPPEQRGAFLEGPALPPDHVEGPEEVGEGPGGDREGVGSADAQVQAVEHLHHLQEVVFPGRVADREQDPGLPGPLVFSRGEILQVDVDPHPVPRLVEEPEDPGHAVRRGETDVSGVVSPEDPQQFLPGGGRNGR